MFVRKKEKLPEDPTFPATLRDLGYTISDTGQISNPSKSGQHFRFRITSSERHNEAHREAFHGSIRSEVVTRLESLGLERRYLPGLRPEPPASPAAFLPILMTPRKALRAKNRIVVIVNSSTEDLGILSWRSLTRADGIKDGSMISFVNNMQARSYYKADVEQRDRESEMPGVVILNPGQLLFSHKHNIAMTSTSWTSSARESAVHPPHAIHGRHNRIPGNKTMAEHIEFVFRHILASRQYTSRDAELYIVGIADGGDGVVNYLSDHSNEHRVAAVAITAPVPVLPTTSTVRLTEESKDFLGMLRTRARAWCVSDNEPGTPLANPTPLEDILHAASKDVTREESGKSMQEVALYPMVAGGNALHPECVMPASASSILNWFEEVEDAGGSAGYINPLLDVSLETQIETLHLAEPNDIVWEGD